MSDEQAKEVPERPPPTNGEVAYEAYRWAADRRSAVTGDPLPEWPLLTPEIRAHWEVSAEAVADAERSRRQPPYRDRNRNYVPPRLPARDYGRRCEVSAPSGWITSEWLSETVRVVAEHVEALRAQTDAAGEASVMVDLEPLFRWFKHYREYAERDQPPRMARVELAGADELNGGDGRDWWWADVSGDGTHWARFEGHMVQVDIELSTFNSREVNSWKGRDEVRAGGRWVASLNRQPLADGHLGSDPLDALDTIRLRVRELLNHPALDHGKQVSYHDQLMYRRVYCDRTPAVVVGTCLDQGCVILRPVGVDRFPMSIYDYDRPDDSIDDPYERTTAKVELWYPPVHWWRDRLVEGEPADAEAWAALIEQERAEEEAMRAAKVAEWRARGGDRVKLPVEVEEDQDPEGTPTESEHQVTERCACLGRPGCFCDPNREQGAGG